MTISRRKLLGSLAIVLGVASVPFTLTATAKLDKKWKVGDYFLAHNDKSIYKLTNIGTPPIYAGNDKAIYWLSIDPFHRLGSMVCPSHIFLTEEQMRDRYLGIRPYPFKIGDRVSTTTRWQTGCNSITLYGTIKTIYHNDGTILMQYDEIWYPEGFSKYSGYIGVQMPMEEAIQNFREVRV